MLQVAARPLGHRSVTFQGAQSERSFDFLRLPVKGLANCCPLHIKEVDVADTLRANDIAGFPAFVLRRTSYFFRVRWNQGQAGFLAISPVRFKGQHSS